MDATAKFVTDVAKLGSALLVLAFLAVVAWMLGDRAVQQLQGRVLTVQPFALYGEKPAWLQAEGLAARVAAEINRVLAAGNELGNRTAAADIQTLPEIAIPETGLSLRSIGQVLDTVVKDPDQAISGGLQAWGKTVVVTLRQGLKGRTVMAQGTGPADPAGLEAAIEEAVAGLLRETQPVIYAAYVYAACRDARDVRQDCIDPQRDAQGGRRSAFDLMLAAAGDPDNPPLAPASLAQAAYLQGLWFHERQDRAAAIEHYGRAIALSPRAAAIAYYHRGNAYQELGDARQGQGDDGAAAAARVLYRQAERDFRRSLAYRPDNAFAWNGLGNAIAKLDPADEDAIEAYQRAIRLMPPYRSPQIGLGKLYVLRRDKQGARAAFEQAALLSGQEPSRVLELTEALRPLDAEAAQDLLARAVATRPFAPNTALAEATLTRWLADPVVTPVSRQPVRAETQATAQLERPPR